MLHRNFWAGCIPWVPTALLLAAGVGVDPAHAQSATGQTECGVEVRLARIAGDEINVTDPRPANAYECEAGGELLFRLINLSTNKENMIVYVSTIGEENCDSREVRERNVLNEEARVPCIKVGSTISLPPTTSTSYDVPVPLNADICPEEGLDTQVKFFFLLSDTEAAPDMQDGNFGCYTMRIDTLPPAAPSDLNSPVGERNLTVRWEPLNDETVVRYMAFYDNQPGSGLDASVPMDDPVDGGTSAQDVGDTNPDCPSDVLRAGAVLDPNDLPDGIQTRTVTGQLTTSIDIPTSSLTRDVTPVAVAAIDRAGNVGYLSEVSCMRIEDTIGFWDAYREKGGTAPDGCACTTLSRGHAEGALPLGLVMLGMWLRARRRTV